MLILFKIIILCKVGYTRGRLKYFLKDCSLYQQFELRVFYSTHRYLNRSLVSRPRIDKVLLALSTLQKTSERISKNCSCNTSKIKRTLLLHSYLINQYWRIWAFIDNTDDKTERLTIRNTSRQNLNIINLN